MRVDTFLFRFTLTRSYLGSDAGGRNSLRCFAFAFAYRRSRCRCRCCRPEHLNKYTFSKANFIECECWNFGSNEKMYIKRCHGKAGGKFEAKILANFRHIMREQ